MKIIHSALSTVHGLAIRLGASDQNAEIAALVTVQAVAANLPMIAVALITPVGFTSVTRIAQGALIYGYLGVPRVQRATSEWAHARHAAQQASDASAPN